MNIDLNGFISLVLPKLLFLASNFLDDLFCFFLSHLGVHLSWLQLLSSLLIASKVIYFTFVFLVKKFPSDRLQQA
ncbi:MAG: hypothetical protein QNJ41_10395 [Xenococcaceae cyanobacterium MO_188.B32]|nr:hypothetical protein [Xenococcaceae cyanobacterium MO_188.B32]